MANNALHGLGFFEVTQAREQVGDQVKCSLPLGRLVEISQVVDLELKLVVGRDMRMACCRRDAGFTQVEGSHLPPSFEECPGMTPGSTARIQHAAPAVEAFLFQ